jgi:thiazole synthase ThiGH ThiG subunit
MTNSLPPSPSEDSWRVGDVQLRSRFLLGTAGYPSPQVLREAIEAAGAQVVTVGLKRTLAAAGDNGFIAAIRQALGETGARLLPNTARRSSWRTWHASCTTRHGSSWKWSATNTRCSRTWWN